jgi:hypothetical protein
MLRGMKGFNSGFWVLIGTTAPVIALACIVLLVDQLDLLGDINETRPATQARIPYNLVFRSSFAYFINAADIAFQAGTLLAALLSVSQNRNYVSTFDISVWESFSLIILLMSSGLTATVKVKLKKFGNTRKPRVNMARHMWNLSKTKKRLNRH